MSAGGDGIHVLVTSAAPDARGGIVSLHQELFGGSPRGNFRFTILPVSSPAPFDEHWIRRIIRVVARVWLFSSTLLKDGSIRIVHINTTYDVKGMGRDAVFVLLSRMFGKKIVVQFHSTTFNDRHRAALRWMARHVFCRGSKVLVFSKKDRKNLSDQLPEGKIEVFPNGIQVDRYRCGAGTFKSRRSIPEGGKAVLFAARLIREKGVYDLLEAIPLVVKDHGNAYFLIAGDGPEKQRMEAICREKGIEERVRFTGHIEGKELIEAYCCADMFIFPTLLPEGMPMVILEALAAGLPIISTASGAVPDMIQDGVNGFIIPSGDPDRLADRIGTLIDRSDWIDRMKKENVRLARREYDREIVLKKLESLYCSL